VLRGLGACLALPSLEAMRPGAAAAASGISAPLRMAFIYSPNGKNMQRWRPEGIGSDFKLSPTLAPLQDFKSEIQVISGLDHQQATAGRDGAGDHARASATFLTGVRAKKTAGADIHLGVSVDQVAAEQIGGLTRLPSLELSCDAARRSGRCDSGYSCAYQFNISWKNERVPMPPEANPRLVFERLFGKMGPGGANKEERQRRARQQRSILDFVMEDAQRLQRQLGRNDQQKLDEYLGAVRATELRIENSEKFAAAQHDMAKPAGVPGDYKEHIRLHFDLLALAFETDSTRVASFMMAHDGNNRSFREIGVAEGHHSVSHHGNDKDKLEKIAKIDRFYVEQLGYFLARLKAAKDIDGRSVLDNSMVLYGCGMADPNSHSHYDLPILLAGRGGGKLQPGRHIDFKGDVPLSNLYLTMLEKMGVNATQHGDSTSKLPGV